MTKLDKSVKQALDNILNKVGLPAFYMSVSHLYDVGYRNMTHESVESAIAEIRSEKEPMGAIMTNDFKIFLVKTAFEIRESALPLELAQYVSKT